MQRAACRSALLAGEMDTRVEAPGPIAQAASKTERPLAPGVPMPAVFNARGHELGQVDGIHLRRPDRT
eukprot:6562190-Pyramimonas_sp.AAC.3